MNLIKTSKTHIIAATIGFAAMLFLLGCKTDAPESALENYLQNRNDLPSMTAENIHSVVSEFGQFKYRVAAPKWLVFDRKSEPYWEFPAGIKLERLKSDSSLQSESEIESQYAIFFEKKELWELRNNVKARNALNEVFETEQLFWDQKSQKVYSDKFIRIRQATKIITGVGFESNQDFTRYTISQTRGEFDVSISE